MLYYCINGREREKIGGGRGTKGIEKEREKEREKKTAEERENKRKQKLERTRDSGKLS